MEIKCLIVDDEVLAQDVIEKYIDSIPTLRLAGKCDSAVEAISFLHNNPVDLMFLDLNMPELSGLDMLKTLSNPPKVILTTAYSEFALDSYEYGVVDYLLKPIKLERFIKAINKVVALSTVEKTLETPDTIASTSIFIKEDHYTHQVASKDIYYVEAYGNYLKVHARNKVYVTRETMHGFEKKLAPGQFMRVHKSFIVSLSHIDHISGNRISIAGTEIPVGEIYKLSLKERTGLK